MTKIFLTGASGYIGGTVLKTLTTTHPEYEITALVRTADQASKLKDAYPSIAPFLGNLDDSEGLTCAAATSDIIIHTANADHATAARSLLAAKPKFLIHNSGGAILPDLTAPKAYGTAPVRPDEEYSDIKDLSRILSFPRHHLHREVDDIIISGASAQTRTAVICPPVIYGLGTGAFSTTSVQIPQLVEQTLKRGRGFYIGDGGSEWSFVHVVDLAGVYLKLVEAAVMGGGGKGADWFGEDGKGEGYYFAESETRSWKEVAERVVKLVRRKGGKGKVVEELESLSVERVKEEVNGFGAVLWGTNVVMKAERARNVLRWEPKEKGVDESLEKEVEAVLENA